MAKKGMVHFYIGGGKGKTTAAVGLAVRAAGQGLKVVFAQFLKNGASGEISSLKKLGVETLAAQNGNKFIWDMTEEEKLVCAGRQKALLEEAKAKSAGAGLLVLDEATDALNAGMLKPEDLEALLKNRSPELEVVLTGRRPDEKILKWGDYITEMRPLAHPFEEGQPARRGIEY